jgi:hypothetical protein
MARILLASIDLVTTLHGWKNMQARKLQKGA